MLGEYKVNRCTRQCHTLGRPLKEGEWYYSVIIESGDDYVRHDYSAESWTEPPEGAIGWWKKRMPTSSDKKLVLAPPEVLVDLLRQMEQVPGKSKSRYLLALMLMRRRIVKPVDSNDPKSDRLHVEVAADKSVIEIAIVSIGRDETDTLRDELNDLLYCEESPDDDLPNDDLPNDDVEEQAS